jgi:glycosyltransferase involved in cell wall biosynthesis
MDGETLIVLPAFNEAGQIATVILAVREAAEGADIVVIDDGSEDDTAGEARRAGVAVVRLPLNMGYGVALQTGYKYAGQHGYGYLVQMDADGQHDPSGIATVLERVKSDRCDVCIGSRFLEGDTYRIPWARRIGMVVFRRVASKLVGSTITDPTSGFQAMNRRVIEFFTRDSYPVDYPDTDVIVMLHHHGFRVAEAPVVMYPPATGHSIHSGLRPVYYLFKMALNIPLNLLRREE